MSDEEILAAMRGEGLAVRVEGTCTSLSRTPMKGVMVRLAIRAPRCLKVLRHDSIDESKLPGV